jgi:hypothetical protein
MRLITAMNSCAFGVRCLGDAAFTTLHVTLQIANGNVVPASRHKTAGLRYAAMGMTPCGTGLQRYSAVSAAAASRSPFT